jgi:hypothetical protein
MSFNKAISVLSLVFLLLAPLIGIMPISSGENLLQSMNYPLEKADASFRGVQSDAAGASVEIVGDVNGDGLDDLLIGAPGPYGSKNAGRAFLIFSKAGGRGPDFDLSGANVTFKAEDKGDMAGWAVSGAGDVNGDGLADILIGAPYSSNGGHAYLILGRTSGWSKEMDLKSSSASYSASEEMGGFYVDGAGDVNGDGLDDILIYSHGSSDTNTGGYGYLVLGKKDGWKTGTSLSSSSATITGLGYSQFPVAGAGDVNGDGFDDMLLLGSENKIYLMLGASSGWSGKIPLSESAASFILEDSNEQCPVVTKAGDVNGDGLSDLLIAAPLYPATSGSSDKDYQGKSYLVFGKKTGWAKDVSLSDADASFIGAKGDILGWTQTGGGDVNGDGLDDIAIMAGRIYGMNSDPPGRPETYLILGNKTGWTKNIAIEKAAAASYLMEANRSFTKGLSTSMAGDASGDGVDDLLIGDAAGCEGYTTDPSSCPGETYLVFPTIGMPNNPPKVEPVGPTDAYEGKRITLKVNATDLDKDFLTYSLADAPPGATISASGDIEYIPVASDYRPDPYNIKVLVSDGKTSSQISITLTVHFELMTLNAGPVLSSEGAPLEGAQILMTVNGTPFTNTTGSDGLAHFVVPKSMNGSKVQVNISKDGYNKKGFQANVDKNKGVVSSSGQYPKLSKKTDTKVASMEWPLIILILIGVFLILIVLIHRARVRRY